MIVCISLAFIFAMFGSCHAGECCDAYYDLTFDYHDQTWCDNYCCGSAAIGLLECCDNFLLQASSDYRSSFCLDFFAKNIWVPILIGLGGLGLFLTCAACCYCCFHSSTSSGRVVAPAQQPYHTNVMLLNPQAPPPQYGYHPSTAANPAHPVPSGIQPADPQTESKHPFEST